MKKSIIQFTLCCSMAILMSSCFLFRNSGPTPTTPCKKNTELEQHFLAAITEQNLKQVEACINEGVNINGGSCSSQVHDATNGACMWYKVTIYDYKPFFLEAIATGNSKIIKMFIEKNVNINQSYKTFDYEKDRANNCHYYPLRVTASYTITTLDAYFMTPVDYETLELMLEKGVKITKYVKGKAQSMKDEQIIELLNKYGAKL